MSLRVLIPVATAESDLETTGTAQRSGLDGATLGVMYNSKQNAREMLTAVADLLVERYDIKAVVGPVRTEGIMLPTEEQIDEMAAECDVVLTGLGDCSSCSALSTHIAIDFERRGVPAVPVGTKPFVKSIQAMGARHGRPDFAGALVEHPLSSLDEAALRERAQEALPQVLALFGVEDGGPGDRGGAEAADVGR
ncbi:MAG: hypothetical protein JST59_09205 [Actinobacteria bacterium]|nr:hypothetical protein [Actinomycetota bacterium]